MDPTEVAVLEASAGRKVVADDLQRDMVGPGAEVVGMGSPSMIQVSSVPELTHYFVDLRGTWEVVVGSCLGNETRDRIVNEVAVAVRCCSSVEAGGRRQSFRVAEDMSPVVRTLGEDMGYGEDVDSMVTGRMRGVGEECALDLAVHPMERSNGGLCCTVAVEGLGHIQANPWALV